MIRVKGIYEGGYVRLLEPVCLEPDTPVEVLIPEMRESGEQAFLERLLEEGLLSPTGLRPPSGQEVPFGPVCIEGVPLSQTVIQERR